MFPWIDGFHWSAGHIIFLSLFFAAVLIILSTFVSAVWRTTSALRTRRASQMCWRATFAELPEAERYCRHQLTGRAPSRICDNTFDCRHCDKYLEFAALPVCAPAPAVGVNYTDKSLYHRGHTWVQPQTDGTLILGLDEFAHHLIGLPDSVELPAPGAEIENEGIAWRMKKNGHEIRVRAPIDGTVISAGGAKQGWYLKIRPREPVSFRHLLRGPEIPRWLAKEIDRLQLQLSAPGAKPCLADGGTLMPDLMDAEPQADWDTILASTFLDT